MCEDRLSASSMLSIKRKIVFSEANVNEEVIGKDRKVEIQIEKMK